MKKYSAFSFFIIFMIIICFGACKKVVQEKGDMIIYGGTIYTVNDSLPVVEAVVVKANKIIFTGTKEDAFEYKSDSTETIDLKNKILIPGFNDSHGHFLGMGNSKLILDLRSVKNYEELVLAVKKAVDNANPGDWIIGRGWHQDKWEGSSEGFISGFPTHQKLSEISPDNPVLLTHASGHSCMVNALAMNIAGISPETVPELHSDYKGGEIITDNKGNPTGILNENAILIVQKVMPNEDDEAQLQKKFNAAIKESRENGITSFHDAGQYKKEIDFFLKMKEEGKIGVRMNVMIYGDDSLLLKEWFEKGPLIDTLDHLLTIRTVKLLSDGALGNRGAWLTEAYSDKAGWFGINTFPPEKIREIAEKCLLNGFQLSTHAIGDRANHEVLNMYEAAFKKYPEYSEDHRFRIEHVQHLLKEDVPRFSKLRVLAAMQSIHMSSDRPWAIDRLGEKRIKEGAYIWQTLIKSGAHVMNGTDVPVEPVNPIACFYAAVTRKTLDGTPEGGYEPDQRMTREQALRSYTLNGAYGSFEEAVKGSIEVGKLADFAVLDKDIMTIPEEEILQTKVVMTIFNGKVVFLRK